MQCKKLPFIPSYVIFSMSKTPKMRITPFVFLFVFSFCNNIFSQTTLSGIINHYTKVTALQSECTSQLTVQNTDGFFPGSGVLIIQMQGASIDQSNSSSFGNIIDMGGSGFYEKNLIDSIVGNEIYLKYEMIHAYNVTGKVQLIDIPAYKQIEITGTLTAQAWNGETGGVLAFEAEDLLTLQANIDVSAKGFRGGIPLSINPNNCSLVV